MITLIPIIAIVIFSLLKSSGRKERNFGDNYYHKKALKRFKKGKK